MFSPTFFLSTSVMTDPKLSEHSEENGDWLEENDELENDDLEIEPEYDEKEISHDCSCSSPELCLYDDCQDMTDELTITADETILMNIESEVQHHVPQSSDATTQTYLPAFHVPQNMYQPLIGPFRRFSRMHDQYLYQHELNMITQTKVLCSLDLLENLFKGCCRHESGCIFEVSVSSVLRGTSALITWQCPAGHKDTFCTSHRHKGLLANNIQVASAILFSGNNFAKIQRFAEFSDISLFSSSVFYRYQNKLLVPVVGEWWEWMQGVIFENLKDQHCVLSGDGQCDSPGFSAKYLSYYMQELTTKFIVNVEVLDKRMVDGKSPNMEIQALKNSIDKLKKFLTIVEVTTDASTKVISEMSMKQLSHKFLFIELIHTKAQAVLEVVLITLYL